jgi:hypothetical protein
MLLPGIILKKSEKNAKSLDHQTNLLKFINYLFFFFNKKTTTCKLIVIAARNSQ